MLPNQMLKKFSLFCVLSLLAIQCSKNSKASDPQRDILIELYQKNTPTQWRQDYQETWGKMQPVCKWFGVVCNEQGEITELDISGNHLTSLPESIGNLRTLRHLCIDLNHLKELPDTIKNLQELIQLDMAHNEFYNLPESILYLKNVKVLSIFHNHLQNLPESIKRLEKLEVLNVYHNRIRSLPESITDLKNLKLLNISHNNSDTIPSLDKLTELVVLDVSKNYGLQGTLSPIVCQRLKTFKNKKSSLTCPSLETK